MGIINLEEKLQIDHRIKTAKKLEAEGKTLHAIQLYKNLIKDFSNAEDTYIALAELYEKLDNISAAFELLYEYLELFPENKDMRKFVARFLIKNESWNEAIEVLSYLSSDEEPIVSFLLGYSHFMIKESEHAKVYFLKFVLSNKEPELIHEAYLYLAKINIHQKNFDNALVFLKKAEKLYSSYWEIYLLYAIIYYYLEMEAHSLQSIKKAIKLNENEPNVLEWCGKIFFKNEDYPKAEKYFLKFIDTQPEISFETYFTLAEAFFKQNKFEDALNYYELALKLKPDFEPAIKGKTKLSELINKVRVENG